MTGWRVTWWSSASRTRIERRVGARTRTRTGMTLRPRDFKSLASTNFAIRAIDDFYGKKLPLTGSSIVL